MIYVCAFVLEFLGCMVRVLSIAFLIISFFNCCSPDPIHTPPIEKKSSVTLEDLLRKYNCEIKGLYD